MERERQSWGGGGGGKDVRNIPLSIVRQMMID